MNDLNNSFSEIYESIVKTKVKEDDILRYFWMAFSKYGYNTENPLSEIKAYFKSKEIKEITLFAQLLSRAFIQVIAIEADQDFYMMNLRRLDRMAQSYPLLLKSKIMAKVEEKTYGYHLDVNGPIIQTIKKVFQEYMFRFKLGIIA